MNHNLEPMFDPRRNGLQAPDGVPATAAASRVDWLRAEAEKAATEAKRFFKRGEELQEFAAWLAAVADREQAEPTPSAGTQLPPEPLGRTSVDPPAPEPAGPGVSEGGQPWV